MCGHETRVYLTVARLRVSFGPNPGVPYRPRHPRLVTSLVDYPVPRVERFRPTPKQWVVRSNPNCKVPVKCRYPRARHSTSRPNSPRLTRVFSCLDQNYLQPGGISCPTTVTFRHCPDPTSSPVDPGRSSSSTDRRSRRRLGSLPHWSRGDPLPKKT